MFKDGTQMTRPLYAQHFDYLGPLIGNHAPSLKEWNTILGPLIGNPG